MNKKKIIILISVLAGLCVLLTAVYFYIDSIEDKKDYQKNLGTMVTDIFDFDSANTDTMTLINADGDFTFKYILDSNSWEKVSSTQDVDHSDYALNSIAHAFSVLQSIGTVTENADDLSIYGLDNPSKIQIRTKDGKDYEILIGGTSFGEEYYYAMLPNTKIVYKISKISGNSLSTNLNKIINTYILDVAFNDVTYFYLEREGETIFELQGENQKYSLTAPLEWTLNYTEVQDIINGLVRSQATQVIAEGEDKFEEYGFDEPFAVVKAKAIDGQEKTVYFTTLNLISETIYGFMDNRVLEFSDDSVFFIWESTRALMDDPVYLEQKMRDVNKMTVEYDGYVTEMDIAPNAEIDTNLDLVWKYKKAEDESFTEIPIKTIDLQSLMNKFYVTVLSPFVDTVELDAEPSGESFLKITLNRNIEPYEITIEYIWRDETTFYVMKNGEYAGVTARYSDFETADKLIPVWQTLFDNGLLS